jgi:hypothetical protein
MVQIIVSKRANVSMLTFLIQNCEIIACYNFGKKIVVAAKKVW